VGMRSERGEWLRRLWRRILRGMVRLNDGRLQVLYAPERRATTLCSTKRRSPIGIVCPRKEGHHAFVARKMVANRYRMPPKGGPPRFIAEKNCWAIFRKYPLHFPCRK